MSNVLKNLRAFAQGTLSESALGEINKDIPDFEDDEEFIQECMNDVAPILMQMMVLEETADQMDEATQAAFIKVQDYMINNGIITEAASVRITNPKINVVHLNKQAQINRLTTILTLKMARKAKSKNYTKYKLGQKIKKTNMEEMRKKFGNKAAQLSKKLWTRMQRDSKVKSAVKDVKKK